MSLNSAWLAHLIVWFGAVALPFSVTTRLAKASRQSIRWLWVPAGVMFAVFVSSVEERVHLFVVLLAVLAGLLIGITGYPRSGSRYLLSLPPLLALYEVFVMRVLPGAPLSAVFYDGPTQRALTLLVAATVHMLLWSMGVGLVWFIGRLCGRRPFKLPALAGVVAVLLDSELALSPVAMIVVASGAVLGGVSGYRMQLPFTFLRSSWLWLGLSTFCWDFLKEGIWEAFAAPRTAGAGSMHMALVLTAAVTVSYAFFGAACLRRCQ